MQRHNKPESFYCEHLYTGNIFIPIIRGFSSQSKQHREQST